MQNLSMTRNAESWLWWLPEQPRKKVCFLWTVIKLHVGGWWERPRAAGLRIQIPPGINLKDKPHKQRK